MTIRKVTVVRADMPKEQGISAVWDCEDGQKNRTQMTDGSPRRMAAAANAPSKEFNQADRLAANRQCASALFSFLYS